MGVSEHVSRCSDEVREALLDTLCRMWELVENLPKPPQPKVLN
jgi:hypothetical protein